MQNRDLHGGRGSTCNSIQHTVTLSVTDSDGHQATHSVLVNIVDLC